MYRQGAWHRSRFNAILRENEPTGMCQKCWGNYPMPTQDYNVPLPMQMSGRPSEHKTDSEQDRAALPPVPVNRSQPPHHPSHRTTSHPTVHTYSGVVFYHDSHCVTLSWCTISRGEGAVVWATQMATTGGVGSDRTSPPPPL